MTENPSFTLRARKAARKAKRARARSRRDFQELAAYLEDQSWRAFAILIGERLDARARALALAFVAACAFVLVASALASGC